MASQPAYPVGGYSLVEHRGQCYVFGGLTRDELSGRLFILDARAALNGSGAEPLPQLERTVSMREVQAFGDTPPPQAWHHCAIYEGRMYLLEGLVGSDRAPQPNTPFSRQMWRLDLASNRWESLPCDATSMPPVCMHAGSTVLNGVWYFYGGFPVSPASLPPNGDSGCAMRTESRLYAFTFATGEWEFVELPDFAPLWGHSMSAFGEDTFVMFGGVDQRNNRDCNDLHLYNVGKGEGRIVRFDDATDRIRVVRALHRMGARDDPNLQLHFEKGDLLSVLPQRSGGSGGSSNSEWLRGFAGHDVGHVGYFPASFVEPVQAAPLVSSASLPPHSKLRRRDAGSRYQLRESGDVVQVEPNTSPQKATQGHHSTRQRYFYRKLGPAELTPAEAAFKPSLHDVPLPRSLHSACVLRDCGRLVVFSGEVSGVTLSDGWTLGLRDGGAKWEQLPQAGQPPPASHLPCLPAALGGAGGSAAMLPHLALRRLFVFSSASSAWTEWAIEPALPATPLDAKGGIRDAPQYPPPPPAAPSPAEAPGATPGPRPSLTPQSAHSQTPGGPLFAGGSPPGGGGGATYYYRPTPGAPELEWRGSRPQTGSDHEAGLRSPQPPVAASSLRLQPQEWPQRAQQQQQQHRPQQCMDLPPAAAATPTHPSSQPGGGGGGGGGVPAPPGTPLPMVDHTQRRRSPSPGLIPSPRPYSEGGGGGGVGAPRMSPPPADLELLPPAAAQAGGGGGSMALPGAPQRRGGREVPPNANGVAAMLPQDTPPAAMISMQDVRQQQQQGRHNTTPVSAYSAPPHGAAELPRGFDSRASSAAAAQQQQRSRSPSSLCAGGGGGGGGGAVLQACGTQVTPLCTPPQEELVVRRGSLRQPAAERRAVATEMTPHATPPDAELLSDSQTTLAQHRQACPTPPLVSSSSSMSQARQRGASVASQPQHHPPALPLRGVAAQSSQPQRSRSPLGSPRDWAGSTSPIGAASTTVGGDATASARSAVPSPSPVAQPPSAAGGEGLQDELVITKQPGAPLGLVFREGELVSVKRGGAGEAHGADRYVGRRLTHVAGVPLKGIRSIKAATRDMRTVRFTFKATWADDELAEYIRDSYALRSRKVMKKVHEMEHCTPVRTRAALIGRMQSASRSLSPTHLLQTTSSLRKRRSFCSSAPETYPQHTPRQGSQRTATSPPRYMYLKSPPRERGGHPSWQLPQQQQQYPSVQSAKRSSSAAATEKRKRSSSAPVGKRLHRC